MQVRNFRETLRREACFWAMGMLAFAAYLGWDRYWTADHWYRLDRVYVSDAVEGAPVTIAVDRTIISEFDGRYTVTVRRLPGFSAVCSGGSTVAYTPRAHLPDPLTLEWWSYGAQPECMRVLHPGEYEMETCITIEPHVMLLGPRRTCRMSNIFEIMAEGAQLLPDID